jgi:V8-like Glu-specific endopeptidase
MFRLALLWLGIFGVFSTNWSGSAAIFDQQGQRRSESPLDYAAIDWQMLNETAAYSGIGLIKIQQFSTCTGFLLNNRSSAPAYVVTNAHCIDLISNLPGANEIIINRKIRSWSKAGAPLTFTPNYFAQVAHPRRSYEVQKVLYATMKNNDVALLELLPTQGAIAATGIVPLNLAPKPSPVGEKIAVVGVPGARVPFDRQFLHRSTCTLGATVPVQEGIYTWPQSLRNRCSVVGGMSGSPLLAGGQVVGIINTSGAEVNLSHQRCLIDEPCELRPSPTQQPRWINGNDNYGQLLTKITTCFNRQGIFDLFQPSCHLDKPDRSSDQNISQNLAR